MKTIATHNSGFHTDDVFAVATLDIFLNGDIKIIRTRDENIISGTDYVVDVGSIYNESTNRFDHHQEEGAGKRKNGIPYASFGLVWKKYGEQICGSKKISDRIDYILVQSIDASDNGVNIEDIIIEGVNKFSIRDVITTFLPTWKETNKDVDEEFKKAVSFAKTILLREIEIIRDKIEAEKIIESVYKNSENKSIILFDETHPELGRHLISSVLLKYKEPIYAVYQRKDVPAWQIVAINKSEYTFETRKPFPEKWAGKKDNELTNISGINDAYFCHNSLFMCLTKSKEGALALAKAALEH